MKILHFCLSSFFIDNRLYQENELVLEHVRAGHEVLVVASTEVFDPLGNVAYTEPGTYVGPEGARVIRLPYRKWLPHALARRLRSYPGVRAILDSFRPDVIMFHGSSAWELLTVAAYVRDNPATIFNIDSHSDAINSGNSFLSREILHRRFYAPILRFAMRYSGPLLCVSLTMMDFASEVYRIPRNRMEFFPLGGRLPDVRACEEMRWSKRRELGISDDDILIVQSGKQNRLKKLPQSLRAFAQVVDPRLHLAVAGVLQDDIAAECTALMAADKRVRFLGWLDPNALTELLCAADVYLQPGTQSATMQHSLCCGCAMILDALPAHEPYINGNGWLVSSDNDLKQAIQECGEVRIDLMKSASVALARRMLDYSVLSQRILL